MDESRVGELMAQLERPAANRAATLAALRAATDLDWGDDVATWKLWWSEHLKERREPTPAPPLRPVSPEHRRARDALRDMGLIGVDDELRDWGEFGDLARYVRNRDGTGLHLSQVARSSPDALAAWLRVALAARRVDVTAHGAQLDIDIDGARLRCEQTGRALFAGLRTWLAESGSARQVYIDQGQRLRCLSVAQRDACARSGVIAFRLIHPTRCGEPHPGVVEVCGALEHLGYTGLPPRDVLAWEIDDGPRKIGTQILELADAGVAFYDGELAIDHKRIEGKLSRIVGAPLPRLESDRAIEQLDHALRGGPLKVVLIRGRALRFVPVASGHIADFARWVDVVAAPPDGPRAVRSIALALPFEVTDVVPGIPHVVFDSEWLDEDAGYDELARELIQLAGGAIARAALALDDAADLPSLISCIDAAAAAVGDERRCHEYRELHWGQESGLVLATASQAEALRESRHIVEPEDEDESEDED